MYQLILSEKFVKQVKKLSSSKSLRLQIQKTFIFLNQGLGYPSLRTHKLSGKNLWSISVNRSIRIVARWGKDKFYLLEIGKHEEVY